MSKEFPWVALVGVFTLQVITKKSKLEQLAWTSSERDAISIRITKAPCIQNHTSTKTGRHEFGGGGKGRFYCTSRFDHAGHRL